MCLPTGNFVTSQRLAFVETREAYFRSLLSEPSLRGVSAHRQGNKREKLEELDIYSEGLGLGLIVVLLV